MYKYICTVNGKGSRSDQWFTSVNWYASTVDARFQEIIEKCRDAYAMQTQRRRFESVMFRELRHAQAKLSKHRSVYLPISN